MRIVVTHTSFSLYWAARLSALERRLRADGAEMHVVEVTGDGGPYAFANGESNGSVPLRTRRLFGQADIATLPPATVATRLWGALDEMQPDVVLAGAIAFTPGATAVRWCRTRRRGVVVMDDARSVDVPRSAFVNAVKRRVYANVDAMFVPAPSHLSTCEGFGVPTERVFFGVNAIDNEFFRCRSEQCRDNGCRDVRGEPLPERYFLGVGRQVPKKNWLALVGAYARYRATATADPWDLVLVGDGPDRPAIASRIRELSVADVHLMPFVAQQDLPIVYANAGCLVLPSLLGETWGLVVNEAMACGLPLLVSNECGCAGTLVEPGGNGWTFSPHDERDMAAALARVAALDAAARQRMGQRSEQIVRDWSLDRFTTGARDAIRACAGVRRGFASRLDRAIFSFWKGNYRPT